MFWNLGGAVCFQKKHNLSPISILSVVIHCLGLEVLAAFGNDTYSYNLQIEARDKKYPCCDLFFILMTTAVMTTGIRWWKRSLLPIWALATSSLSTPPWYSTSSAGGPEAGSTGWWTTPTTPASPLATSWGGRGSTAPHTSGLNVSWIQIEQFQLKALP